MSPMSILHSPKAPRWISTEAGLWAWSVDEEWRRFADRAMNVADRRKLLADAERMRRAQDQLS